MGILKKMLDSKMKFPSNPMKQNRNGEVCNECQDSTSTLEQTNLYAQTSSAGQTTLTDKIIELTINMLEYVQASNHLLVAEDIVLLISGGLLTSLVGYYSLDESFFMEYATQINETLASSIKKQLDRSQYHWMINEYMGKVDESDSDDDAHYDASVMTLLLLTISALDIKDKKELVPLHKQCKKLFNELLLFSSNSLEMKSVIHSSSQNNATLPDGMEDALSKIFLQYAHKVVKYCSTEGSEVDLTSTYPKLSGVFLMLFSSYYEMDEAFTSKRIQALNQILTSLRLNALSVDEIKTIKESLLTCDTTGHYVDLFEAAANTMLQILENANGATHLYHNRESLLNFCDKSMREMLCFFQKLFTSPNAIKHMN